VGGTMGIESDDLSEREREVLMRIAQGFSNTD
jgi:ATP/maltotriose-dependent transcriptional regulator MalT